MNIRFSQLSELKIQAQDGEIGNVHDVLFDENRWIVRYVVVDTGGWLTGRKVLVSPIAIEQMQESTAHLPVTMTKAQVKDSPDIRTDLPLSQDQEVEYHDFFRWPYYWGGGGVMFGTGVGVDPLAFVEGDTEVSPEPRALPPDDRDYSLRSMREVSGYKLSQPSGETAGEVADFVIDTSNWTVSHLAIQTDDSDAESLLPVELVRQVGYPDEVVVVHVALPRVRTAPAYNHETVLDQAYMDEVAQYYKNEPVGRQ